MKEKTFPFTKQGLKDALTYEEDNLTDEVIAHILLLLILLSIIQCLNPLVTYAIKPSIGVTSKIAFKLLTQLI